MSGVVLPIRCRPTRRSNSPALNVDRISRLNQAGLTLVHCFSSTYAILVGEPFRVQFATNYNPLIVLHAADTTQHFPQRSAYVG